jgi:hypothetical protein
MVMENAKGWGIQSPPPGSRQKILRTVAGMTIFHWCVERDFVSAMMGNF